MIVLLQVLLCRSCILLIVPHIEIQNLKFKISFFIEKNKWYLVKVLLKRFHLNGHTMGFRPQTQKLELHYMSP